MIHVGDQVEAKCFDDQVRTGRVVAIRKVRTDREYRIVFPFAGPRFDGWFSEHAVAKS
jgi:hypothetical protein